MSLPENPRTGDRRTGDTIERLAILLRELNDLLGKDAAPAQGASPMSELAQRAALGRAAEFEQQLQDAARRLDQMAEMVHAAMQSAAQPLGSPSLNKSRPASLGEAVQHALDVLASSAARAQVRLECEVTPPAAAQPAGALYTVILNGVLNAIEAVARAGKPGRVQVVARADAAPAGVGYGRDTRDWFVLEIADDGGGPPAERARVFDLGFTTKPGGAGVGLAVARGVVQGMGGTIELLARPTGGSLLRVRVPALAPSMSLGGAA